MVGHSSKNHCSHKCIHVYCDVYSAFVAEVRCYLLDRRGFHSELKEFNFVTELDPKASLKKIISENAPAVRINIVIRVINCRC